MKPASPAQAAAIAAAIERFQRASAPGPTAGDEQSDPWVRAAILEGVAREDPGLAFPALG
jgi:hypothetical protein